MRRVRKAADRGHFDHGWLNTSHTFSFGEYYDEAHMNYRALRVINDDVVAPGMGFGMHAHRDMEIITYVLEGALEHKDSMGNGETLTPGEVQYMSAGTGIRHSEFNPSSQSRTHLYQIWIMPDRAGHAPRYDQRRFDNESTKNKLGLVASPDGRNESIAIHQDAELWLGRLDAGTRIEFPVAGGKGVYLQVAKGSISLPEGPLVAGDGLIVEGENLDFQVDEYSEVLLFHLS